jgi:hypothetical protein
VLSQFSVSGSASVTSDGTVITIAGAKGTAAALSRALPSTPYTITVGLLTTLGPENRTAAGISLVEANTVKRVDLFAEYVNGYALNIEKNNADGTFAGSYPGMPKPFAFAGGVMFFRVRDDGSLRTWQVSCDGANFITLLQQSRTDFVTPGRLWIQALGSTNYEVGTTILYYSQQ